jgi:hypothetical protein
MIITPSFVNRIAEQLPQRLGPQFEVASQGNYEALTGTQITGTPDIAIRNRQTNAVTLLDIAGFDESDDLPFVAVSVMKRLKDANLRIKPQIVLVTASQVDPELQEQFNNNDIKIIAANQEEAIVNNISNFVLGS